MSDTPELDKQHKVINSGEAGKVQDFLDWLLDDQRVVLAAWDDEDCLQPLMTRREQIMADYFKIDLDKLEAERRALLEQIRSRL